MASLVKWLYFSGARGVDGLPVASGSIYFYVPGSTSTPITIYADPDKNATLTQPVTLDAAGRAEVYLEAPAKVKVLDALGASVRLTDRGESTHAGTVDINWNGVDTDLETAFGDIETKFGQGGQYQESGTSGVVPRTYQSAVHRVIEPSDFGAYGNGTADDTVPLQKAIDRAIAAKLPLYLGGKTYKVTSGLTVNGALHMYAPSKEACLIFGASAGFNIITADSGSDIAGLYFHDFSVLAPAGAGVAISVARCHSGVFDGLNLSGTYGMLFASGCTGVVSRCVANLGTTGWGFTLTSGIDCIDCIVPATVGGTAIGFDVYGGSTLVGCGGTGGTATFQSSGTSTTPSTFIRCYGGITGSSPYVSIACDWNPVPGAVAGTPVTVDYGTISRVMVENSPYSNGLKKVSFLLTNVSSSHAAPVVTLAGVAAMATGIQCATATRNDLVSDAVAVDVGTATQNTVTVRFTNVGGGTTSAFVQLTGI